MASTPIRFRSWPDGGWSDGSSNMLRYARSPLRPAARSSAVGQNVTNRGGAWGVGMVVVTCASRVSNTDTAICVRCAISAYRPFGAI